MLNYESNNLHLHVHVVSSFGFANSNLSKYVFFLCQSPICSKPQQLQVGPSSNVQAHHLQGAPTTEGILDLLQILRVQLASHNFHEYFEITIMVP